MTNRSEEYLEKALQKQLGLLRRSADAFDEGYEDEDIRLAQILRVLFHHTRNSKSLFSQIAKYKADVLKVIDTSFFIEENNEINETPLIQTRMEFGKIPKFSAPLSDALRKHSIPFKNWWRQICISNGEKYKLSRADLILQLANKEGGSHIDPDVTLEYAELIERNGHWAFYVGDAEVEKNLITSSTMRQIAHEVLATLVEGYHKSIEYRDFGGSVVFKGMSSARREKIGVNDRCPCDSGMKYKKCHARKE